jgi:hypothetical protein
MEKNSLVLIDNEKLAEKVQIILRQTDYTEEIALEKLKEHNFDEIATIKSYFGIPEKKSVPIKSVNQEIYKQLRSKLDASMYDYREKEEQKINNVRI